MRANAMTADLPEYFFRVRENGAVVFRISTENRQRRIEMDEIAIVNVRSGNIKPQAELTDADRTAIANWLAARQALLAEREVDDILRTVDHLNLTTQWAQSRATEDQLETVTDTLLLAMHDLRTVLVRKKADRLIRKSQ
jgi:hypothetical protein